MMQKLFMFYPEDYSRMYVLGASSNDVLSRSDELFHEYMKTRYSWWLDEDDQEFIKEKQNEFMLGIFKLKECPNGIAIDSHY